MGVVPAEDDPHWTRPCLIHISSPLLYEYLPKEVAVQETKRLFNPGDEVMDFQGQCGRVLSPAEFQKVKSRHLEGRRPGSFFAPGCCSKPDYLTQVPVLFEDGTYDVMKAVNLRKHPDLVGEKKGRCRRGWVS
jgi:hypothetical protein